MHDLEGLLVTGGSTAARDYDIVVIVADVIARLDMPAPSRTDGTLVVLA